MWMGWRGGAGGAGGVETESMVGREVGVGTMVRGGGCSYCWEAWRERGGS
jgi:hypothetical protein